MLKSHIFVEHKRDDSTKEDVSSPTERDDSTKEDISSPTEPSEAVMLTCVIDVQEERDVAVANIPNAFSQNAPCDEDAEHQVIVRIWGPLVGVLVSIAPDVYGLFEQQTRAVSRY